MALQRVTPQRDELRNELVAIIAAGRELSPEHDYVLADIYLDLTKHRQSTEPWYDRLINGPNGAKALIGVACLGFALLAFSMLAFGARHDRDGYDHARSFPAVPRPLITGGYFPRSWPFDTSRYGSTTPPGSDPPNG
jgi:hypothetical protein